MLTRPKSYNDGDVELCQLVEVQLDDEYGEYAPLGHQGKRSAHQVGMGLKTRIIMGLLIVLIVLAYIANRDSANAVFVNMHNTSFSDIPEISEVLNTPAPSSHKKETEHPTSEPTSEPTNNEIEEDDEYDIGDDGDDINGDGDGSGDGDIGSNKPDPTTDDIDTLKEIWGKWHFWDGEPESRPKKDYLSAYPNKDCPADDFPETAWQGDGVYVNHFLDSGSELITRAKEALYTEYGWGPKSDMDIDRLIARKEMFKIDVVDDDSFRVMDEDTSLEDSLERGGWTTKSSFHALTKRLLHAMMTNDDFTVIMGGDSAAAGYGNHFLQSYMMQFHRVMEPIFSRLGMNLITRNIAHGGLGTMQNALGSGSLYGDEVDIMLWDSSLTESTDDAFDLFCRQALIGGKRPPVLWSTRKFSILKDLHLNADADIMEFGNGMAGVPTTESIEQAETLPWAVRNLKCPEESKKLCDDNENRFRTTCWIDRDDVSPLKEQRANAPSQVKQHPGFRAHQLTGRVLAFTILDALQDALDTWSEETITSGHPLPDEYWHITDHYENIQNKAKNLDPTVGKCNSLKAHMPERVCTTPLQGRTEFTPRANPQKTSITSIIKPTTDEYIPKLKTKMLYDGPDVAIPSLMIPNGEVDVHTIVGLRRRLLASQGIDISDKFNNSFTIRHTENNEIVPGNGWEVSGSMPGNCDGTATGICGRLPDSDCLLYGHMDARGGILGNANSGWLVMNLSNVSEGLIMLKIEPWHKPDESTMTDTSDIDNAARADMIFDYAINGHVTSLANDEFQQIKKLPQELVELLTIMDDPGMTQSGGAQDIEVAIRLRNCGRLCTFRLTHVYWA